MQLAPDTIRPKRPGTIRSVLRLLSCIRFDEVLVLQGSPLLGAIFSVGRLSADRAPGLMLLATGSCCLAAHVFVLNDWSGMTADCQDPNRTSGPGPANAIGRRQMTGVWMVLLALSLLLLGALGLPALAIALAIAGLSALYSAPAFHLKGAPVLSSALHIIGGWLYFLLGYSAFRAVDTRGVEIGCFFALAFTAGHLTHEVRDRGADLLNGIRTNAVRFGARRTFAAGLALFTVADALLVVLAARGTVPRALMLVAAFYPVHLYWSVRTMYRGLTFENVRRLQVQYRGLYATIGLLIAATVLLGN